jgi:hypothetical protein
MQSTVYVSNAGMHDYSSLEKWGSPIKFVTTGDIDRMHPERLQLTLVRTMHTFQEHDYLVFSGSPIPFGLCLAYLFRKGFEQVRVLYWMRKTNTYFEIVYTGAAFDKADYLVKE